MGFEFRCQTCNEIHKGMPRFGSNAPLSYYAAAEAERASRCELGTGRSERGELHCVAESLLGGASIACGPVLRLAERLAQALSGHNQFEKTGPSSRPRISAMDGA